MNGGAAQRNDGRRGITLVVVLGFIAILVVLAVSLSVTMRIERLATASYEDTTRARHLIHAALAGALDDMDVALAEQRYPSNNYLRFVSGIGFASNVFGGIASNYIPDSVYPYGSVPPIPLQPIVMNDITCRIGYLAINCSGLLDANTAGGATRGRGIQPEEIPLSPTLLPEVGSASAFVSTRSTEWRRFESVAEMFELGRTAPGPPLSSFPNHLFNYSLFRLDRDPTGNPKVFLGGTAAELDSRKTDIVNALSQCQVPNPDKVFLNLQDYVDDDFEPRDLASFCTESVPMINEVIFSNTVIRNDLGGGNVQYVHRVYCTIETWYPFPGSRDFTLTYPPPVSFPNVLPAALKPDPSTDLKTPQPPPQTHPAFSFLTTTYMYEKTATNVTGFGAGGALAIRARMDQGNEEVLVDSKVVDRVNFSALGNNVLTWTVPGAATLGPPVGGAAAASVYDPRVNYDMAFWGKEQPTPKDYNNLDANFAGEGISPMYVRDFPLDLSKPGLGQGSVAELGFLSVGQPWRTISLITNVNASTPFHPVLDWFTVEVSDQVQGKVNINASNTAVLASAFYDMPVEPYPGAGGGKVTTTAAWFMAQNVIKRLREQSPAYEYYTNRSTAVLGRWDSGFVGSMNNLLPSTAWITNDALQESLIRNSHRLVGVRENLFTVFLYAQVMGRGGLIASEQRAVALVWRDPERDAAADWSAASTNTHSRTFVKFFKWL